MECGGYGIQNVIAGIVGHKEGQRGDLDLQVIQGIVDLFHDLYFVGAGLLVDGDDHAIYTGNLGRGILQSGIHVNGGDLIQTDGAAGGKEEDGVGNIVYALVSACGGDREDVAAIFHVTAGVENIGSGQIVRHIIDGQAISGQGCGVDIDRDLAFHTAADLGSSHAFNALQSGNDLLIREGLQAIQIVALQGDDGQGHHVVDVEVIDDGF